MMHISFAHVKLHARDARNERYPLESRPALLKIAADSHSHVRFISTYINVPINPHTYI